MTRFRDIPKHRAEEPAREGILAVGLRLYSEDGRDTLRLPAGSKVTMDEGMTETGFHFWMISVTGPDGHKYESRKEYDGGYVRELQHDG